MCPSRELAKQIKDNIDYFAEYLHKEGDMPLIRYLFFPDLILIKNIKLYLIVGINYRTRAIITRRLYIF